MSIVNVTKKWSGPVAGDGSNGPTATEIFTVLLDASSPYGHVTAKNAPGIPRIQQRHPNVSTLYVTDRNSSVTAPSLYEVTVTYGSKEQADTAAENEEPTAQPFHIQKSWEGTTEAVDTDINGDPILNSAGEPFDPPLSAEILDELYVITGWLDDTKANRDRLDEFNNTVSSDTVYGRGAGRGRMRTAYNRITFGGRRFLEITIEILFRKPPEGVTAEQAWDRRVLDQGYRELVTTNGVTEDVEITDALGKAKSQPTKLDGEGHAIDKDAEPYWHYFRMHRRKRFGELDLPPED